MDQRESPVDTSSTDCFENVLLMIAACADMSSFLAQGAVCAQISSSEREKKKTQHCCGSREKQSLLELRGR